MKQKSYSITSNCNHRSFMHIFYTHKVNLTKYELYTFNRFIQNSLPLTHVHTNVITEQQFSSHSSTAYQYIDQIGTVQIFNSFTSRLDVCQCLVVQAPIDNMSKTSQHINDQHSLRVKFTFSCEVTHAFMPKKLGGNLGSGLVLCLGWPRI